MNILSDVVSRNWTLVTLGTVVRLALGFLAGVVIARALGPEVFAVYVLLSAVLGIVGSSLDFGLTPAAVKRVAEVRPSGEAQDRGRWYVALKVCLTLVGIGALAMLTVPLSSWVFAEIPAPSETMHRYWHYGLAGVFATALSGSLTALLQATERFGPLSIVLIVNSGLTLVLALVLVGVGRLDLTNALLVLGAGTSIVSAVVAWTFLRTGEGLFSQRTAPRGFDRGQETGELFRFGRWLWIVGLLASLSARGDLLLVGHWLDPLTIATYGLALNLAGKVEIVHHSLHTVLLPRASSLQSESEIGSYLRSSTRRSAWITALLVPLLFLVRPLVPWVYGSEFVGAVAPLQLLLVLACAEVWLTPFLLLAYPLGRPRVLATTELWRTGLSIGIALWAIPLFGIWGALLARAIGRVSSGLWAVVRLRRDRIEFGE